MVHLKDYSVQNTVKKTPMGSLCLNLMALSQFIADFYSNILGHNITIIFHMGHVV